MADFLSKFTGQQIDQILESVADKVSTKDIVDVFTVGDSQTPASSRLTFELSKKMEQIQDTLDNKVIRSDGLEQTIDGKKKFASPIYANGGIIVPTGKSVSITDDPISNTDAVNLNKLKKNGVSEDSAPVGSGLQISALPNGYNQLKLDVGRLATYNGDAVPDFVVASTANGSFKWSVSSMYDKVFNDVRLEGVYVKIEDYDADMLSVENQLSTINTTLSSKLNTSVYNTKMTSLDSSIQDLQTNKVSYSAYNTKMTSLDASISTLNDGATTTANSISQINTTLSNKVDTTTYTSGLAGKVDVTTYNTKMTSVDSAIANRVTLSKTNVTTYTVAASGSQAFTDFTLVNLCQVLVTAQWGTGTIVDTYRVTITRDGTIKTELLIQKSTAGTITFAGSVVSGKLRLTVTNANTTTACSVDYVLISSF